MLSAERIHLKRLKRKRIKERRMKAYGSVFNHANHFGNKAVTPKQLAPKPMVYPIEHRKKEGFISGLINRVFRRKV